LNAMNTKEWPVKEKRDRFYKIDTEIPLKLRPSIKETEQDVIDWYNNLNEIESRCEELIELRRQTIKDLENIEQKLHDDITRYFHGSHVTLIVNNVPIFISDGRTIHINRIGKIHKRAEIYPNAVTNEFNDKSKEFGLYLFGEKATEQFIGSNLTYEAAMQKAIDFVSSSSE